MCSLKIKNTRITSLTRSRRYMAEVLPTWRKTQNNQSINQPIILSRNLRIEF